MDVLRRHLWRLAAIGAAAIAIPQLALALDSDGGGAFKLAMGPTSAPLKIGGPPTAPERAVPTCAPSEGACPKPHHRSKRRHAGFAPTR